MAQLGLDVAITQIREKWGRYFSCYFLSLCLFFPDLTDLILRQSLGSRRMKLRFKCWWNAEAGLISTRGITDYWESKDPEDYFTADLSALQSKCSRFHKRETFWFLGNVTSSIWVSIDLWIFSVLSNIFFMFCLMLPCACARTYTHICIYVYTCLCMQASTQRYIHFCICNSGNEKVIVMSSTNSPPYFSIKTHRTWNPMMKVNKLREKFQHSLCFCLPSTGLTDTGCQ